MKRSIIIILVLLTAALGLGLAACGSGGGTGSLGEIAQYEPDSVNEQADNAVGGSSESSGSMVREDEEDLVSVRIEGGGAEISFNLERWSRINTGSDKLSEGPFQIVTMSSGVADAVVGKVAALDLHGGRDYIAPAVALLTEDGRVEFFLADPSVGTWENEYRSYGVLPWLKNIESLTYEKMDGISEKTIYAWDSKGLKYDISLVGNLTNIFYSGGAWEFFYPNEYGTELYLGMVLSEDGAMDLVLGMESFDGSGYEADQRYSGTYEVFLAENGNRQSGTMDVDLECTWWLAELGENPDPADKAIWDERMHINATYSFSAIGDGYLNMFLKDGQALMYTDWHGTPITKYNFWQTIFDY